MGDNGNWEEEEEEEDELEFSRNYFLAKELASSVKKSKHKLTDIDVVDEQVPILITEVILCILSNFCLYFTFSFYMWLGTQGSCNEHSTQA